MPTPAPCLDEQTVLDWIEGRLTAEERGRADEHLEGCEACREWVASLASRVTKTTEVPELPTQSEGPDPEKPAMPSLSSGQRLAHYTIQGILGTGGMSVVYAALDEDLGRTVALKILRPNMAEVGNVRARLVREAQAMARLSHPNVVTVYEAKEEQGQLYIAMERVEGRTLRRWMAEEHPPLETLVGVFVEAGKGLAAAHAVKMVHRDFKPGNVLIGRDGRVRVTDFGLARTYASGMHQGVDRLTAAGMFVGTPEYASPEQLMGLSLDARSDQFCFCVAFFEAIYGGAPRPTGDAGRRGSIHSADRLQAPRGSAGPGLGPADSRARAAAGAGAALPHDG